jgi:hypothetical protein
MVPVIVGASGAVKSIFNAKGLLVSVLEPVPVDAVIEYCPSAKAVVVWCENSPAESAVAEPNKVDPLYTFTVEPATATPESNGVVSFVGLFAVTVKTTTCKVNGLLAALTFPEASVAVAVMSCDPELNSGDVNE